MSGPRFDEGAYLQRVMAKPRSEGLVLRKRFRDTIQRWNDVLLKDVSNETGLKEENLRLPSRSDQQTISGLKKKIDRAVGKKLAEAKTRNTSSTTRSIACRSEKALGLLSHLKEARKSLDESFGGKGVTGTISAYEQARQVENPVIQKLTEGFARWAMGQNKYDKISKMINFDTIPARDKAVASLDNAYDSLNQADQDETAMQACPSLRPQK